MSLYIVLVKKSDYDIVSLYIVHVLKSDYDILSLTVHAGVLKSDYDITKSPKLAIAFHALNRICYITQSPQKHLLL